MTVDAHLDDLLANSYDCATPTEDGWRIKSPDDAAWASRKIAEHQRQHDQIAAWAKREHARIDAVAEREMARPRNSIDFLTNHLHVYLDRLLQDGRKVKSLDLPGGRISVRTIPSAVKVDDPTQFLDWARANAPDLVVVKESVKHSAINKRFAIEGNQVLDPTTGEVVPHVTVEPSRESASFKPHEEEA